MFQIPSPRIGNRVAPTGDPAAPRDSAATAAQQPDATRAAVPYLLTRLYEGKRPFHPEDQDTLHFLQPRIRVYDNPNAGLDLDRLVKVGEPANSRALGVFLDPSNGRKYHIKKSPDPQKAHNEVLFANLARRFGVNVPEVQVLVHDGKTHVASAFVENLQLANALFPNCAIDPQQLAKIPEACPKIGAAFAAAALLNNRDIIGIGCDNVGFLTLPDGSLEPVFVDFGGSGAFRATSGKKSFDADAAEFSSMTEPTLQASSMGGGPNGLVFGPTPRALLQASFDRILAVPDADIRAEIDRHIDDAATADSLFDTLLKRRDAIHAALASNAPSHFQRTIDRLVQYGIVNAFEWDDEDPTISSQVREAIGPQFAEHLRDNMHLLADSTGQMQLSEQAQALAAPHVDRLWHEKNPGATRAEPPRRFRKTAAVASTATPTAES